MFEYKLQWNKGAFNQMIKKVENDAVGDKRFPAANINGSPYNKENCENCREGCPWIKDGC